MGQKEDVIFKNIKPLIFMLYQQLAFQCYYVFDFQILTNK